MNTITRQDILSPERYEAVREQVRHNISSYIRNRCLQLGKLARLYFENRTTVLYQVQELIRTERLNEKENIQNKLDVYNNMIPNGTNWKATFILTFSNSVQRDTSLMKLFAIEDSVWLRVSGFEKVFPVSNEDVFRTESRRDAIVHFFEFPLKAEMIDACLRGEKLFIGIEHQNYFIPETSINKNIQQEIVKDLNKQRTIGDFQDLYKLSNSSYLIN